MSQSDVGEMIIAKAHTAEAHVRALLEYADSECGACKAQHPTAVTNARKWLESQGAREERAR